MRRFRPDIVHTHSYVMRYAWPSRALAGHGRIVHTVHNVAEREVDAWDGPFIAWLFAPESVPVAVSTEVARSFRAVYGFAPAAVIPNGVDTRALFRPDAREAWRRDHGFAPGDLLVVSVARLDPQKNPPDHRGLRPRVRRPRSAHLVMGRRGQPAGGQPPYGRGPGDRAARAFHRSLRRCRRGLLSACDIFLLASAWEGSPVAVIEAMAAALPVVATAVGGVPELVEHGVTGLLAAGLAISRRWPTRWPPWPAIRRRRQPWEQPAAARAARFDSAAMVEAYAALFEKLARRAPMKPRIVLLITGLEPGGAEMQVVQLAAELGRRGWEVTVISLRGLPLGMRPGRRRTRARWCVSSPS